HGQSVPPAELHGRSCHLAPRLRRRASRWLAVSVADARKWREFFSEELFMACRTPAEMETLARRSVRACRAFAEHFQGRDRLSSRAVVHAHGLVARLEAWSGCMTVSAKRVSCSVLPRWLPLLISIIANSWAPF